MNIYQDTEFLARTRSARMPEPRQPRLQKREVGPIEEGWINFQPHFPAPVAEHTLPTIETMEAHPLTTFIERATSLAEARDAELLFIADTQKRGLELETVAQELARIGIASFSLSSSSESDDSDDEYSLEITDDTERAASRYGTAYITPDPALVRRVEWERWVAKCGQAIRFMVVKNDLGKPTFIATRDKVATGAKVFELTARDVPPALLQETITKIATAVKGRTLEDIIAARERATFLGGVGSMLYGVATGDHEETTTLDLLIETREEEADEEAGPKELGLHGYFEDVVILDPNEPEEKDLWPISVRELALTLMRGLRLKRIEYDWLDQNPDALGELRALGVNP